MQVLHPNPAAMYTGLTHAFSKIASTEGLSRLWRGIWSVVVGAGPSHAVYFASYEHMKEFINSSDSAYLKPFSAAIAGATATISADALMNPFDVVKQRMQLHGSSFNSVFRCAMSILEKEGVRAFYVSYPTTLFLNVPFHFIQFPTYEFTRDLLNPNNNYDPVSHIASGAVAGTAAAALTTPIDVIKTILQTKGESSSLEVRNVNGTSDAIKLILKNDGYKGFFRGWKPRVLTHMPSTAVCWTTYEYFKWVIGKLDDKKE